MSASGNNSRRPLMAIGTFALVFLAVGMVVTNQTFTYNGSASRALTLSGGANFNANAGTLNVSNNISGTMVIMPANQGATIQLQSGGSPP